MIVIFKNNFHIIYIIYFSISSLYNDEKVNNIKPRYLIAVLNDKKNIFEIKTLIKKERTKN